MPTAHHIEPLGRLCYIQIGYTARGRLEPMEGGTPAIQLRDTTIGVDGGAPLGRFRLEEVPDRYWVRAGDVLFRSRGDSNTASALGADFIEPAVAVMPLVILRTKAAVLPEYVAWYVNQPEAQGHFEREARGTSIRMIPMSCLADLKIPVPDLATQQAIAAVDGLAKREFALASELAVKRRQLIAAALLSTARESIQNNEGMNARQASRPDTGGTP